MIGYVTIGTTDMSKAKAFYSALLEPLGGKVIMEMDRIAFIGSGMDKPMLAVCIPYDENDPKPGNGTMLAFPADTREDVDKLYASAIALGATDEGAPGERMPTFYGGYFRDLDGNKAVFYKMG
ncbi:MAG: VOC family protein [Pseudomonadales bacterium]|jgi:predicted lactoylglutathione lyase|tara:strand:- start:138 stop:506 length:369 start_codon:yes stop_codon:yes gene_type:complete